MGGAGYAGGTINAASFAPVPAMRGSWPSPAIVGLSDELKAMGVCVYSIQRNEFAGLNIASGVGTIGKSGDSNGLRASNVVDIPMVRPYDTLNTLQLPTSSGSKGLEQKRFFKPVFIREVLVPFDNQEDANAGASGGAALGKFSHRNPFYEWAQQTVFTSPKVVGTIRPISIIGSLDYPDDSWTNIQYLTWPGIAVETGVTPSLTSAATLDLALEIPEADGDASNADDDYWLILPLALGCTAFTSAYASFCVGEAPRLPAPFAIAIPFEYIRRNTAPYAYTLSTIASDYDLSLAAAMPGSLYVEAHVRRAPIEPGVLVTIPAPPA